MKSFRFLGLLVALIALHLGIHGIFFGDDVFAEVTDKQFEDMMKKYLSSESGQKALGSTIESYFKKKQEEAQKQQAAMADAQVEEQFKTPVKIDAGTSPAKGPKDAKITIIEFSDFQCPYCKRGKDTMDQVMKSYPNDVKVVFKHMPLPFHKEATPAAKASYAAMKQGKFWEFHDELFGNQQKLGADYYLEVAKSLGLNVDQFKKDMESPEAEQSVKNDTELGQKNGIQGTPGFFVNGVAVRGAYPYEHFKKIVDRWLSKDPTKKAA